MRCGWIHAWMLGLVLVLFVNMAWSEDPLDAEVPDPEIVWIIENSPVGVPVENPNRLLFTELDLPMVVPSPALRGVDLGVDLDLGRRLLESPPEVERVKPESLVGL